MSNTERLFPIGILEKSKSKELIPNFEKGEFYLADYLNKKLPKEWNIYTRPELKARWGSNQNKKTPDIVIAHPQEGIMIFEVKNWNISNFFVDEIRSQNSKPKLDIYQKIFDFIKIVIEIVDIWKWLSCATARACRHVIVKPSIASTFDRKLYKVIKISFLHNTCSQNLS